MSWRCSASAAGSGEGSSRAERGARRRQAGPHRPISSAQLWTMARTQEQAGEPPRYSQTCSRTRTQLSWRMSWARSLPPARRRARGRNRREQQAAQASRSLCSSRSGQASGGARERGRRQDAELLGHAAQQYSPGFGRRVCGRASPARPPPRGRRGGKPPSIPYSIRFAGISRPFWCSVNSVARPAASVSNVMRASTTFKKYSFSLLLRWSASTRLLTTLFRSSAGVWRTARISDQSSGSTNATAYNGR